MAQSTHNLALELEGIRSEGIPLWQIAQNVNLTRYFQGASSRMRFGRFQQLKFGRLAAAVTILFYDTLLTFRDEVRPLQRVTRWLISVGPTAMANEMGFHQDGLVSREKFSILLPPFH